MRYRTRELTISAVQWKGTNYHELMKFVGHNNLREELHGIDIYNSLQDSWIHAYVDDYIVQGLKGEFSPIDQEEFKMWFSHIGHDDFEKHHIVLQGGIHDGKMIDTDVDSKSSVSFNGDQYMRTGDIVNGRRVYVYRNTLSRGY